MRIKLTGLILFVSLAGLSVIALAFGSNVATSGVNELASLTLKANSPKDVYLLGDAVELNFAITNEGSEKMALPGSSTVEAGYLRIYIAYADQPFKDYFGNTRWQVDAMYRDVILEPGQSFLTKAIVLRNAKPDFSGLSDLAIKQVAKDRIISDYAFPEAGVYSIKAVLRLPGGDRPTIESEPIKILMNAPAGDDLVVWNQIKDSREVAYFLQFGELPTIDLDEQRGLFNRLEGIVATHPNSLYSIRIREGLEKLRSGAKRQ